MARGHHAGWIVAMALAPLSALAEDKPAVEALYATTLDMDHDGRMDRAVMVQHPGRVGADLYIYLAIGDAKLDLSRRPAFLKPNLTTERILGIESRGRGSLAVTYGCGGCSNDDQTTLTIVQRRGTLLVARFTRAWDTRTGMGSCAIDFLAGTRVVSQGLDEALQSRKRFRRTTVRLATWSDDRGAKACASGDGQGSG